MGWSKKMKFKDKEIEVKTLKTGQKMRLEALAQDGNLAELILASLSESDKKYIDELDYEVGIELEIAKLVEVWKEVNPDFFREVKKEEVKEG
jgi:hypothetical protein